MVAISGLRRNVISPSGRSDQHAPRAELSYGELVRHRAVLDWSDVS